MHHMLCVAVHGAPEPEARPNSTRLKNIRLRSNFYNELLLVMYFDKIAFGAMKAHTEATLLS